MEHENEKRTQTNVNFFYREAISELGRFNDRRFARSVSRSLALSVFAYAILYFLTH